MHCSALRVQRNPYIWVFGRSVVTSWVYDWNLCSSHLQIFVVDFSVGLCCFVCLFSGVIFTSCATLHQGLLLITTEIVNSSIRLEHELSWAASAVIKPGAWTLNQFLPGGVEADFQALLCVPASPGQWSWAGCVWASTAVCVLRSAWAKCSPHFGCVGFTVGKILFN